MSPFHPKILISLLLLILPFSSLIGEGQSETVLDVPWFGQEEKWKENKLGDSDTLTIGTHGCALTATSMVLSYYGVKTDPQDLNKWLLKNNGFEKGWDDTTRDYLGHVRLIWDTPVKGFSEIQEFKRYDFSSDSADLDLIRSFLDKKIPVIAEVIRPGGIPHFVVLIGYQEDDFFIRDPLDRDISKLSEGYHISDKYGSGASRNIFGVRIYIPSDHS